MASKKPPNGWLLAKIAATSRGDAMNGNNEFRWGRGFLHAGLAFGAAMAVGFVALFVIGPADPGKFGEAVGRMACFSALFALAASWGKQTGQTWAFLLGGALAALMALVPLALPLFLPGGGKLVMLPEEKAEFLRIGDAFCQPALGWGFDDPGEGFLPHPEAQQSLLASLEAQKITGHAWAWLDEAQGQLLLAQVFKLRVTRQEFESFAKGFRGSLAKAGGKIGSERLDSAAAPYTYRIDFTDANGLAFDVICRSAPPGLPLQAIACLTSAASDHEALAKIRESAAWSACG